MKSLQKDIRIFSEARGWMKAAMPADYAKSVLIEAAELLEIFQWSHPTKRALLANPELTRRVKHELADVFIYAINLANLLEFDAALIIREKMTLNGKKYPVASLKANPGNYHRLKTQFRIAELQKRASSKTPEFQAPQG